MKLFLSAFFLFLGLIFLPGQHMAPFQLEDNKAVPITKDVFEMISEKAWFIYKKEHHYREGTNSKLSGHSLTLFNDGTYQQGDRVGKWSIWTNKVLYLAGDGFSKGEKGNMLLGGFSIHRCSEEQLVLVKNLTSSFDNQRVYYFETKELHEQRKAERLAQRKNRPKGPMPKKMTLEEILEMNEKIKEKDFDREALINDIKKEAFMRGIKIKENLFDYSKEDLINYLKKIKIN